MKLLMSYKPIALLQMFVSACFFLNPGTQSYGTVFGTIHFFTGGILFCAGLLSFIEARKWKLWLSTCTMLLLIALNSVWFIVHGTFITTGFMIIGYDLLAVVANLHFLGKGL
jgi:hypothetical protein